MVEIALFEKGWVTLSANFRGKGSTANEFWRQKTRVPGLSRGVVCVILHTRRKKKQRYSIIPSASADSLTRKRRRCNCSSVTQAAARCLGSLLGPCGNKRAALISLRSGPAHGLLNDSIKPTKLTNCEKVWGLPAWSLQPRGKTF